MIMCSRGPAVHRARARRPASPRRLPVAAAAAAADGDPDVGAAPAAGKPVAAAAPDRGEGAASPDTPLAFPEEDEEDEAAAAAEKKSMAHEEWVQEQRGVVASLSHENAHLLKQIEEFKARLQHSRSTNDSLKQMQSKARRLKAPSFRLLDRLL